MLKALISKLAILAAILFCVPSAPVFASKHGMTGDILADSQGQVDSPPAVIFVSDAHDEEGFLLKETILKEAQAERDAYFEEIRAVLKDDNVEGFRPFLSDNRGPDNSTLLRMAARENAADIVKFLIDNGKNVNEGCFAIDNDKGEEGAAKDYYCPGKTPLHEAAEFDAVDAARTLIDNGAMIGARNGDDADDDSCFSPLHYAAKGDSVKVAKLLIERGAEIEDHASYDLECTLNRFVRPLHVAASRDSARVAKLLIDAGANVGAFRPMQVESDDESTPLHDAAAGNAVRVAKLLIDGGANVNFQIGEDEEGHGWAPLHMAAWSNAVDMTQLLLDNGAKIDAENGIGETPLHSAAQGDAVDVMRLLIRMGANIDKKSDGERTLTASSGVQDQTLLHMAAKYNAAKAVKLLIDLGADVNDAGAHEYEDGGITPLHMAARAQDYALEAAKVLIDNGAEVNAKDKRVGWTPLDWAMSEYGEGEKMQSLLRQHGGRCNNNC